MFINEYGNRNDPTIILLTPMMISGSDLYDQMSRYFRGSYHIIAPDQGGHGKAGAYISADEEYQTLKSFLLETFVRISNWYMVLPWALQWLTGFSWILSLLSTTPGLTV